MIKAFPAVSVLMPAFNAQETLQESVRSVLEQTFNDFELIIIDDGSTDGTADVAQRLAEVDQRVRVIRQTNAGVSAARNRGLAEAKGHYISLLDADDLWVPDKLESQWPMAGDHTVVVGGVRRFFFEGGQYVWGVETMPPEFGDEESQWLVVALLRSTNMVLINTMLAPRVCVEKAGGWNPRLRLAEDWDLWLRLSNMCRFTTIAKPLQLYRKHSGSATALHTARFAAVQKLTVLDAFAGTNRRSHLRAARVSRLLENAESLRWSGDIAYAGRMLLRAATYPKAWSEITLYRETYRLLTALTARQRAG